MHACVYMCVAPWPRTNACVCSLQELWRGREAMAAALELVAVAEEAVAAAGGGGGAGPAGGATAAGWPHVDGGSAAGSGGTVRGDEGEGLLQAIAADLGGRISWGTGLVRPLSDGKQRAAFGALLQAQRRQQQQQQQPPQGGSSGADSSSNGSGNSSSNGSGNSSSSAGAGAVDVPAPLVVPLTHEEMAALVEGAPPPPPPRPAAAATAAAAAGPEGQAVGQDGTGGAAGHGPEAGRGRQDNSNRVSEPCAYRDGGGGFGAEHLTSSVAAEWPAC